MEKEEGRKEEVLVVDNRSCRSWKDKGEKKGKEVEVVEVGRGGD